jgi:chemotaxis protein MotB
MAEARQAEQTAEERSRECTTELEKALPALQAQIDQTASAVDALKQLISTRLQPLITAGTIAVEIRGGRMIVKLPSSVLFAVGSADLNDQGQSALAQVSSALADIGPYDLLVAGHTDDQPIHDAQFADNWDLSTARAVTVVRFLVEHGLDPHRLVAAGMAEFDPIAPNDDDAGRELNRRIEIVVFPHVQSLVGNGASQPAAPPAPIQVPSRTSTTSSDEPGE